MTGSWSRCAESRIGSRARQWEKGLACESAILSLHPRAAMSCGLGNFRAVERVDTAGRREFRRLRKKSSRDYWLVFLGSDSGRGDDVRCSLAVKLGGSVAVV